MSGDETTFGAAVAILAMAAMTHGIRFAGYWMMARVPLTPRLRRMLDALPGAVIAATIVPIVLASGAAGAAGIAVVVAVMAAWRNEFLAVIAGVGVVALARAAGL